MHQSSLRHVQDLLSRYIIQPGVLVDIGSTDVNGTYRPLFPEWRYIGIDTAPGPGVDLVARNPYRYPLPSASVDLVVCGQVFEHMEYFWIGLLDMCRLVKPGGLMFLLAPSRGPEHRYPVDCWRSRPIGAGPRSRQCPMGRHRWRVSSVSRVGHRTVTPLCIAAVLQFFRSPKRMIATLPS